MHSTFFPMLLIIASMAAMLLVAGLQRQSTAAAQEPTVSLESTQVRQARALERIAHQLERLNRHAERCR
jgi:hypothetical protein